MGGSRTGRPLLFLYKNYFIFGKYILNDIYYNMDHEIIFNNSAFRHDMTEEDADVLDEYYTKNPPKVVSSNNGGYFTARRERLDARRAMFADQRSSRSSAFAAAT